MKSNDVNQRFFTCRACNGAGLIKWTDDPQDAICCEHCEDDELCQLYDSQMFKTTPFPVEITKLYSREGGWSANAFHSYQTHAGKTPEDAFFLLMEMCGWCWDGRWVRWITS